MSTNSFELGDYRRLLTSAARNGYVKVAQHLIQDGADLEENYGEGYTPLMEAAREGHEEMVAFLLSRGADFNAESEGETALTLACGGGFLNIADILIKVGADIESGAVTPLMKAAQNGHLNLVGYLLESAADVHVQTRTKNTALTYACMNGHTRIAKILLQFGANIEHESEGGETPLMKACRGGHLRTVKFLIQSRADLKKKTTTNNTPLSLAVIAGHDEVVALLLPLVQPYRLRGSQSSIRNQSQQQDSNETETSAVRNIDLPSQSTSHGQQQYHHPPNQLYPNHSQHHFHPYNPNQHHPNWHHPNHYSSHLASTIQTGIIPTTIPACWNQHNIYQEQEAQWLRQSTSYGPR